MDDVAVRCTEDCSEWLACFSVAVAVQTSAAVVWDLTEFTAEVVAVAVFTASLVTFRLTTPDNPPFKKPVDPVAPAAFEVEPLVERRPTAPPKAPATVEIPRVAIMTSASMEPPVCPTLTPKLAIKLSIF